MTKRREGLNWDNMEKVLRLAAQLARLIDLLRRVF
jgi:hypothetical protein